MSKHCFDIKFITLGQLSTESTMSKYCFDINFVTLGQLFSEI